MTTIQTTTPMALLSTIHRADQIASEAWAAAASAAGLDDITDRQAIVLQAISTASDQSQTDIVEATGVDRSTIADIVTRLVDRQLVIRKRNPKDGRAYMLALSDTGKATVRKARTISTRVEKELRARIAGLDGLSVPVAQIQKAA